MKLTAVLLFTVLGTASLVHAQETQNDLYSTPLRRSSCSARSIDRYYCPWFGGGFQGPYFDNGCSVRCASGQRAICEEAGCDQNQNGEPVESHCYCR